MSSARLLPWRRRRQRGSYAIVFALMLMPLMLIGGMAIDLSMAFMRRADLQSAADAAALAAARVLDGSAAGIDNAEQQAKAIITASYFGLAKMRWLSGALRLSDSPDPNGQWLAVGAASSDANRLRMRYARIDTTGLDPLFGSVRTVFAAAIDPLYARLQVSARAVAGRSTVQVTPLAICALDTQRQQARVHGTGPTQLTELIEHGFRRGVSYNLLNLNPNGNTALHFQVNPVDFPPALERASNSSLKALRPMVCSGTLALPFLPENATLYVRRDFPSSLTDELNSRFGILAGSASSCDSTAAPADTNVKEYNVPAFWTELPVLTPARTSIAGSARAYEDTGKNRLVTIADMDTVIDPSKAEDYGPLWAFAKPLKFPGPTASTPGVTFLKADWPTLYRVKTGQVKAATIAPGDSAAMPYEASSSTFRTAPIPASYPRLKGRRILNIPLLSCPVSGGTATVLAVGRFLMTSRATVTPLAVYGEFGGLADPATLASSTVLFR
ncbi:TadE/TadG family type IV pilus assembly protein [Massilia genomosp. 1]|uniref:Pilus assembly protein TadE n=1 Tax=Massilia genomosp. 1 TaxID=2609280 RepID=A0ABX0MJ32_9BURK|nr:pilus assembly protein TadG-related protein [Massilia genomosp. 1]NHZ62052.1 pilus assembly protein TadE [Massilia genomosp. 1]